MNRQKKEQPVRLWILLLLAFGAAFVISRNWISAVRIVGDSMRPTLEKNDWVLVDPGAYGKSSPERGDIVIFRKPEVTEEILVKRIIGIPGDTVAVREGRVYVGGALLAETLAAAPEDFEEITVPPGSYFVLGDNRADSKDSRVWEDPFVRENAVLGKVTWTIYPRIQNLS